MNKKILYFALSICLFSACKKAAVTEIPAAQNLPLNSTSDVVDPSGVIVKTYDFGVDNSTPMFQDNESQAVMTSDSRIYNIARVLRVKAIDEKNIEIANFAPFDLTNVSIYMKIAGSTGSSIRLLKINNISAHGVKTILYPFIKKTTQFVDSVGNVVDLSAYQSNGIAPANVSFDFDGPDATLAKLKKLSKLKWDIKYHDFDPNNDPNNNWAEDITPKQVRRYTGLMINLGLVIVSDDYKQEFLKETIIGNDGITPLTLAEKEKSYNDLINFKRFNCGVVGGPNNTVGLGGGATFGLADYLLKNYISQVGYGDVPAHELGHCVGYNHSSSMTYPKTIDGVKTGHSPVMIRVMKRFYEGGLFATKLSNYYKPADFQ